MIQLKDIQILSQLRKNSRKSLTQLSRETKVPVSTLYDKLKGYRGKIIKKFTALLDFKVFDFDTRATIVIKVDHMGKEALRKHLERHSRVNSLYRINNGFDFMVEGLFCNVKELEDFLDELETTYDVIATKVYHMIDDIKREAFLENLLEVKK
ncbi:MAG: Lrp/AsnC family transcriptional regulator [Candidatus Nanoarchaeia archaeon]|nr:Lrp/AsnC family transcriptional regulator [Candidatus Nanoarchaeia archaeon]